MRRKRQADFVGDKTSEGSVLILFVGAGTLMASVPWIIQVDRFYHAGDNFGYSLGLLGSVLIVSLVLYSMRKRCAQLSALGTVSYWFRYHIVIGIGGTIMVLLHSSYRCASVIGCIALGSMIIVAISGIAGRFARRYFHHCLLDRQSKVIETEKVLKGQHGDVSPAPNMMDGIQSMLCRLRSYTGQVRVAPIEKVLRTVRLHLYGRHVVSSVAILLKRNAESHTQEGINEIRWQVLENLLRDYVRSVCEVGRLELYGQVLSRWHTIHVVVMVLFVIASLAHILAVHMY
jgi:hypothetical protein